jgi:hypothetical protein
MAVNTQALIDALVAKGYNPTDAANQARGANASSLAQEYLKTTVTPDVPKSTVAVGAVSAAPLPKTPAAGFQQGGWYAGRQFWNGTFSQPGQIHPESNQPGAGTMVPAETLAATSAAAGLEPGANQQFINAQYAGANVTQPGAAPTAGVYAGKTSATTKLSDAQVKANELQTSINAKKAEADKRRAEVNNNPWLSEASRVGQIAKIDSLLNDSINTDNANLLYWQKQADTEAANAKPDYDIQYQTDTAGNVTILTVDKKTGKLVSTVSAGKVGKGTTPSGGTTAATIKTQFQDDTKIVDWASEGGRNFSPFEQLVIKYASVMTLAQIYQEYAVSDLGKYWGKPTEDPAAIKTLYDQAKTGA